MDWLREWIMQIAGVIAVGADLLVENGTVIAHELGLPETVIALTFVALGTSLPELITTITSLRKGHASFCRGRCSGGCAGRGQYGCHGAV